LTSTGLRLLILENKQFLIKKFIKISTNDNITKHMAMLGKRLLKSMTMQLGSTEAGEITLGRSRVSIRRLSNLGILITTLVP
jgi:hypothetical protein